MKLFHNIGLFLSNIFQYDIVTIFSINIPLVNILFISNILFTLIHGCISFVFDIWSVVCNIQV